MDGGTAVAGLSLDVGDLGRLMPMFLCLDTAGMITGAGPTLAKILGPSVLDKPLTGVFDIRTPRGDVGIADLIAARSIRMVLRGDSRVRMIGAAIPLPDGAGALINLSFGYALADAVRIFSLSQQDFAATDMAVELLYLLEAKNLVSAEVARMQSQLRHARQNAEHRARTDALTGLGNRRALQDVLEDKLAQGQSFCLINVDLDYFKAVNDTLGHAAGDHVLVEVAQLLRHTVRGIDTVARVGGDEFVVILSAVADQTVLGQIGDRLLRKMAIPILYQGQPCGVALSMGAAFRQPNETLDALMARADAALYASKRAGRRRLTLAQDDGTMHEMAVGPAQVSDRRAPGHARPNEVSPHEETR